MLFGWQFGIWLAITYFFCYKDWILDTLDGLSKAQEKRVRGLIAWGVVFFVLSMSMETANYLIVTPTVKIDSEWTINIEEKCPEKDISEAYTSLSEVQDGLIGLGFGAFFGIIFYEKRNIFPGLP